MPEIGQSLLHYSITGKIGKGGMGEVFRAKDQKLGRDVAIKVLPQEFSRDSDRVARFQREAKLLASLNHPNIAAIYGLEESAGTQFLVLELVEGDTLADRIQSRAIPIEESLRLSLQIAEALEAAHEKGVIHRDLKPANIKVTPEGKVKVLDFGLAKAYAGEQAEQNLSNSPTLSDMATQQGVILGTAAYMSPEQARGKPVDKRADIWAFGVVLFEMLSGRSLFGGDDVSQTLARILERQPDFSALPQNLHPRIRLLLERCLEKDVLNRCGSIGEARADIQKALGDPGGSLIQSGATVEPRNRMRTVLPWAAAALILGLIIAGLAVWKLRPPEARRVIRFEYELPAGRQFDRNPISPMPYKIAVSPDGGRFVYETTDGLYLRSMESLDTRLIPGTDKGSEDPFFSPDGQWVGYFSRSDQKLKKVALSGGAPVVLCDTVSGAGMASWNSDNTIVYTNLSGGIMRVSANGGTPETLVKGNAANIEKEGLSLFPQMLPDGKTILFTNIFGSGTGENQIVVQSTKSGERKVLFKGGSGALYLPTGNLVYFLRSNNVNTIFAVPFDPDRLEVTGSPVPLLEGVDGFAVSESGALVYVPQPATATKEASGTASSGCTSVWVDKQGNEVLLDDKPKNYSYPRISPDGKRVVLALVTGAN